MIERDEGEVRVYDTCNMYNKANDAIANYWRTRQNETMVTVMQDHYIQLLKWRVNKDIFDQENGRRFVKGLLLVRSEDE